MKTIKNNSGFGLLSTMMMTSMLSLSVYAGLHLMDIQLLQLKAQASKGEVELIDFEIQQLLQNEELCQSMLKFAKLKTDPSYPTDTSKNIYQITQLYLPGSQTTNSILLPYSNVDPAKKYSSNILIDAAEITDPEIVNGNYYRGTLVVKFKATKTSMAIAPKKYSMYFKGKSTGGSLFIGTGPKSDIEECTGISQDYLPQTCANLGGSWVPEQVIAGVTQKAHCDTQQQGCANLGGSWDTGSNSCDFSTTYCTASGGTPDPVAPNGCAHDCGGGQWDQQTQACS